MKFNLTVAILRGLENDQVKKFLEMGAKENPKVGNKLANEIVETMNLLIKKKLKKLTEENLSEFFKLLEEAKFYYEKENREQKWFEMVESTADNIENPWISEKIIEWKSIHSY
ncbi:hypothetical protein MHBO_003107 [Bonamia ostreae]|uniref:Uncharacterized protein n=1 Tax=Bonamia ostreae TaxID=126728 RepID=A0ABV2API5_9EUKA